jgi:hypothetical protein
MELHAVFFDSPCGTTRIDVDEKAWDEILKAKVSGRATQLTFNQDEVAEFGMDTDEVHVLQ